MICTNFSITSERPMSHLPTADSLPPVICTAKPKSTEKMMRGSMARRVRRPTKSSAVKKLTIISVSVAYSPISSLARSLQGTSTGGKIFMRTNMITAAMAPVMTKVATVVPMILPARWRLSIPAMDPAMEANTNGTTMQNIMLMNTLPRKAILWPKSGQNQPTRAPATMAVSRMARKR